jgi:alcohol dehydrogenase class IV
VTDYLEVVGRGRPLEAPGAPVVAVPTTAGTGAEATANAVLASPAHRVKVSLRTVHMLPRLAIVDPVLTVSMPPEVTAATGFDAIAQLIECLVSLRATALTDPLCREGLRRGAPALERAWARGDDLEARESMAFASLTGGIGLANAGLGAVHGFAGPIGGMFAAPHGMVCAALLPHVMAANVEALTAAGAVPPALERYREVAAILTGDPSAGPRDGAAWAAERCRSLGVPPLSAWGIAPGDIPSIVSKARRASSMKGNPVSLSSEALAAVLEAAL